MMDIAKEDIQYIRQLIYEKHLEETIEDAPLDQLGMSPLSQGGNYGFESHTGY